MKNSERNRISKINPNEPFDIYIIGLGIENINHVTKEAENALKSCNHAFFVDSGFGVEEYLQSVCPKVTSLLSLYKIDKNRRDAYVEMASRVVDAAFEESPVCFATYGHPLIYVHPTFLIKEAAAMLNLKVKIVAGISAFDTVLIDLGIDPEPEGIQMYEASDVIIKERPLQNDVPCFLWQIDALETGLFTHRRSVAKRFEQLKAYLLRYYPPEHEVTLVLSSTFSLAKPIKTTFTLRDMPETLERGVQSGTLFIPPLSLRKIKNKELLHKVYDINHLKRITSAEGR